ncbi:MAG: aspartate/glutamate racemase family protein, partial [Candidatus Thorarchaeota archaeon]
LPLLIEAAKELEREGVKAITTSCGFTAVFQEQLANAVSIPVYSSSLVQVPLIYRMLGGQQKIGIITADSDQLGNQHLLPAGINESIPIVIRGIQNGQEWRRRIEELRVNPQKLEHEIVQVAKDLVAESSNVGAIVLECTQLPTFASSIQKETKLPVFDIYTLTKMMYETICRRLFGRAT